MPMPSGHPTAGLKSGPQGASAYFASINEKQDRAAAAAVIDPINKLTRTRLFFNPDPDTTDEIFRKFDDPYASLVTIAVEHRTTVEALSSWMARPDIAQRMHHLKTAAADFISVTSTMRLIHARNALTVVLCEYADAACHAAGIQEGRGSHPGQHIQRDRETARKAAQLLMRLANYNQTIRAPKHLENLRTPDVLNPQLAQASPLPRPGGGGAGATATAEGEVPAPSTPTPTTPISDAEDEANLLKEINAVLTHINATRAATPQPIPEVTPRIATFNATPNDAAPINQQPPASSDAREAGNRWLPDAPASGNDSAQTTSPVKRADELPHNHTVSSNPIPTVKPNAAPFSNLKSEIPNSEILSGPALAPTPALPNSPPAPPPAPPPPKSHTSTSKTLPASSRAPSRKPRAP